MVYGVVMIGYRKFIVMLLFIIIGIVFIIMGYINGSDFTTLMSTTGAAFFAANLIGKFTKEEK